MLPFVRLSVSNKLPPKCLGGGEHFQEGPPIHLGSRVVGKGMSSCFCSLVSQTAILTIERSLGFISVALKMQVPVV